MHYIKINELSAYIKLSKSSIYKKVMKREIPFIKATGTLLFNQDEIDQWLQQHTRTTADSNQFLSNILKPKFNGTTK
jgi:excisionase family DNA binding protein